MEMKRCKECGKLFVPRSKRQQYCEDLHYRPCPVCGKLVEAKYLSDPARCCSKECKSQLAAKTRSVVSIISSAEIADTDLSLDIGKLVEYVGPVVGKWIPNHKYLITIEHENSGYSNYRVWASKDVTSGEDIHILLPLASQYSVDRYFKSEMEV